MSIEWKGSEHTSDSEHVQPGPLLPHTDQTNDTDDTERDNGKLLGELVHAQLKRRALLLYL